jgi:hypothetical protein
MRRLLGVAAALAAAAAILAAVSLPPRTIVLEATPDDGTVAGSLHVHTDRSDGRGSQDEVAEAARRANLRFVVFSDHGDGTVPPSPPAYRSGVLCLDGVEISTTGGHYLAIGLPQVPYRLGGEARDVVEDVARFGGFGVVAHPDSPKAELRWREWTAPFDGVEIANLDTGWRVHLATPGWRSKGRLLRALVAYPMRPSETIAALLTESNELAARWEALTRRRRVVAVAGADAHANLAFPGDDPGRSTSLPVPGYEASLRALTVHVRPGRPLTGNARDDARLLIEGLRAGHVYTAVGGLARPASFEFTATSGTAQVEAGDELRTGGAPVTLRIRTNRPPGFTSSVWKGSQLLVIDHAESEFTLQTTGEPAVYRVEVRAGSGLAAPRWIVGNPIYVRDDAKPGLAPPRPPAHEASQLFDGRSTSGWAVEQDPTSVGALEVTPRVDGAELRLRYGLSGGTEAGQFVAAVVETPGGIERSDRLVLTARAERPMRISIQVRTDVAGGKPERWRRSVYLDGTDRERTVFFDEMTPVGVTSTWRPPADRVRAIMFVVDTTNSRPGASGRLWIRSPTLRH